MTETTQSRSLDIKTNLQTRNGEHWAGDMCRVRRYLVFHFTTNPTYTGGSLSGWALQADPHLENVLVWEGFELMTT